MYKIIKTDKIETALEWLAGICCTVLILIVVYHVGHYKGYDEGNKRTLAMVYFQVNSGQSMKDAIEITKEELHAGNIEFRKSR